MTQQEQEIRSGLGIPPDAESVLIFGETSHWDPNWLLCSEQYYERRIRCVLDGALRELQAEPRRVFSVECVFFFQQYFERHPQHQQRIRELVNAGRLRFTGSGVTTPDTTLPDLESILRDYQQGQQWLWDNGMTQQPRLAYLPDDFGCSPALPAMLRALGYEMAALSRIDGMHFVGADLRRRGAFPLPGSSAQLLQQEHRSADFIWEGPDGQDLLCHWNPFTYFQGDMLAALGVIRWMGVTFGIPWRTGRHVARRVAGFVRQLRPLARTPYLFCPIGCDFNDPIPGLVGLLDRYNETTYPRTGVFAVNAGLDDYLRLVGQHAAALPRLRLDPNPYWMGFYATRPEAKQLCNRISRRLVLSEALAARLEARGAEAAARLRAPGRDVPRRLRRAWDLVSVTNHHDFITGTSPERVWQSEQRERLQLAEALSAGILGQVQAASGPVPAGRRPALPGWQLRAGHLRVQTDHYQLALSEDAGGCWVSLVSAPHGGQVLDGPANDLQAYADSGGLWRMGHEYLGGHFTPQERASAGGARIQAREASGQLEVRVDSVLCGRPMTRWLWLRADEPVLRMRLLGAAARRRTVTCRFPTLLRAEALTMDVPGGVLQRPMRKLYDPTFWAADRFVHLQQGGRGLAALMAGPACCGLTAPGTLELVALRNAHREVAWGFLPIPAHPASGADDGVHAFDYALLLTGPGDYLRCDLPGQAARVLAEDWEDPQGPDLPALAAETLLLDRADVQLLSLNPYAEGADLVARLFSHAPAGAELVLRCPARPLRRARLCDALLRDLQPLQLREGQVVVPLRGAVSTVKLWF